MSMGWQKTPLSWLILGAVDNARHGVIAVFKSVSLITITLFRLKSKILLWSATAYLMYLKINFMSPTIATNCYFSIFYSAVARYAYNPKFFEFFFVSASYQKRRKFFWVQLVFFWSQFTVLSGPLGVVELIPLPNYPRPWVEGRGEYAQAFPP